LEACDSDDDIDDSDCYDIDGKLSSLTPKIHKTTFFPFSDWKLPTMMMILMIVTVMKIMIFKFKNPKLSSKIHNYLQKSIIIFKNP